MLLLYSYNILYM